MVRDVTGDEMAVIPGVYSHQAFEAPFHVKQFEPAPALSTPTIGPATPATLIESWPWLRECLMRIKRRQGPRSTWRPEHVRDAVNRGQAELWFVTVGTLPVAFTVTQALTDPFTGIPSWLVWMAYADPRSAPRETVARMDAYLERVARERGFATMMAMTARPGLARRLERFGWKPVLTTLQKDLYEVE